MTTDNRPPTLRPRGRGGALLTALALTALGTAPLGAQQAPPDLGTDSLTRLTRAHLAIGEARDAFHQEIGRIHEEQARLRAREELNQKVADILEAEELTREAYDRFILVISVDAEAREAFEKILAQLVEGRPGG